MFSSALLGRLLLLAVVTLPLAPDRSLHRNRFDSYPRLVLWAWETPGDFRGLDPHRYAVAYLDRTIVIAEDVTVIPRRQPLSVPAGMRLIAVSRIEAHAGKANLRDPELPGKLAAVIAESVIRRRADAVQVDFDARESQKQFYTELLRELRQRLPSAMPLSITALASWCDYDDWIGRLPVDEAVPMYFRMGPEHPRVSVMGWSYPVREPLCRGQAGVSTDEAWPQIARGTRLYIFPARGWNPVALQNIERHLP